MNEESQIDEMRAALRGDRERAEYARQRSTDVLGLVARTEVERPPVEQPPRRGLVRRLLGR